MKIIDVVLQVEHIEALTNNRIFFAPHGPSRLKPGQKIRFAEDCICEPYSAILSGDTLFSIGSFSYSWSHLDQAVTIGRYCSVSERVRVIGYNHPTSTVSTSSLAYDRKFSIFKSALEDAGIDDFPMLHEAHRPGRSRAPVIGHDVWIGQDTLLSRGIELGNGCVVAAGSVVTKSIPPYAIVGGNPAKIIRFRFSDKTIDQLQKSEWWRYSFINFAKMEFDNPDRFLENIFKIKADGRIQEISGVQKRIIEILGYSDKI